MNYEIYALGRAGRSLKLSLENPPQPPFVKGGSNSPPLQKGGQGGFVADILFLSVPDDKIAEVAQSLPTPLPRCVAHLSGAYSYELLNCLRGQTAIAQFHPLAALTGNKAIPPGTLCAIASDQPWAFRALTQLALQIGLIPGHIHADKTIQYHAAAVLTGNLSLALVLKSIDLMQEAGIDAHSARCGLATLLRSVADNLEHHDIQEALTGPIARRDFKTIQKHLEVLKPEVKVVYQTLSHWLGLPLALFE